MNHDPARPITPEDLEDILHSPVYAPWTIAEFEHWSLKLTTSDQSFLGRSNAWLKRHVDRMPISDLTEEELKELVYVIIPAYEKAIRSWYRIDCLNIEWLGNEVQHHRGHGHAHFFPRTSAPVDFNGRTFIDLRPGAQRANEMLQLPEEELRAILEELKTRIRD